MTRKQAIAAAKEAYWNMSRRGIRNPGFNPIENEDGSHYWVWANDTDPKTLWVVELKANGSLQHAYRGQI